jgi:hypothetical protein
MANDATNVSTGKGKYGGYAFIAPAGTALPTDATTALANTYLVLGYISEDGITNATERESQDIKDMNGDTVLTIQDGHSETWQASFIESLNVNVLKMVYGDENVTETNDATTINVDGKELPEKVFVFELVMQNGKAKRIVLPRGKVSEVGDIVYRAGDAIGYDVTIAALPDASGKKHIEYIGA